MANAGSSGGPVSTPRADPLLQSRVRQRNPDRSRQQGCILRNLGVTAFSRWALCSKLQRHRSGILLSQSGRSSQSRTADPRRHRQSPGYHFDTVISCLSDKTFADIFSLAGKEKLKAALLAGLKQTAAGQCHSSADLLHRLRYHSRIRARWTNTGLLSQSEIDALLSSIGSEGTGADSLANADGSNENAWRYDFRRPDRLSKEQMRALRMIHETWARRVSVSLYPLTCAHQSK